MSTSAATGQFYLLGSDALGRDLLSMILHGLRSSLFVAAGAVGLAVTLGTAIGLVAGFRGGWFDAVAMRIADAQLSIPCILVTLLIFGLARSLPAPAERDVIMTWLLVAAIGLAYWVQFARLVRAIVIGEKLEGYIEAANATGVSDLRIASRHILPAAFAPVGVVAATSFTMAIICEATLSYLGLGLPPAQPSLGTLIQSGQDHLYSGEWWLLVFPAVTLVILSTALNWLCDHVFGRYFVCC